MSNGNAEKLLKSLQPQQGLQAKHAATSEDDAIGAYVMRNLGRPPNLFAVQVHQLWEDHYRVNILVGEDAASVTIPHSYFLVMDSEGSCLSSTPALTREYTHKKAIPGAAEQQSGERETGHVHASDVD